MPGQQVAMQRPQEHTMNQPFITGQRLWRRAPTCHNHPASGPTSTHTGSEPRARAASPPSQNDELPKAFSSSRQNSPAVYTFGSSEPCILSYPAAWGRSLFQCPIWTYYPLHLHPVLSALDTSTFPMSLMSCSRSVQPAMGETWRKKSQWPLPKMPLKLHNVAYNQTKNH